METNLTLVNVAEMLLKRWWIILIAFIIGAASFFSYNKYIAVPTYTSSGSLYVNNIREKVSENVNMSDMATSQMLVWTYIELLKSNTFMTTVAETSDLGYTASDISSMISMMPKNDTEIMKVSVVAENPQHAQIIVNTVLENANTEIDRVIKGGSVSVVDYANLPTKPSGPRVLFNTFIGAVLGAVLAAGMILLMELLDNRIKDEDELVKQYEYPVLGNIPNIN